MSRPNWLLRDAALGYASRDIPVLPLHYPLPHRGDLQALTDDQQLPSPAVRTGCSCRDPRGQPGKHPWAAWSPMGSRTPPVTGPDPGLVDPPPPGHIGLATGHLFDVLDVDSPAGERAIGQLAAAHGLASSGPLVRTGGGGGISIWP